MQFCLLSWMVIPGSGKRAEVLYVLRMVPQMAARMSCRVKRTHQGEDCGGFIHRQL